MFKPEFSLTSKIISNISEIERLYGRLEGTKIPKQLLLNLERNNLIESSYASNSIEGNPLSQAEVTNLLLNDRVPTNRDEKEVVNYFKILKELEKRIKQQADLTQILDIHEKLMSGVVDEIKGKIRNKSNVVGRHDDNGNLIIKHDPPFHKRSLIEQSLKQLVEWLSNTQEAPVLQAGIFHHEFVYIHPFEDGNGRVCRLLTALIFLKHNYLINKYFVLDDYYNIDRELYSDSLHSADSGNKTKWLEYFTDGIIDELLRVKGELAKANQAPASGLKEHHHIILNYIKEHGSINDALYSKLVKRAKSTRALDFRSLLDQDLIKRHGKGKAIYYCLKR